EVTPSSGVRWHDPPLRALQDRNRTGRARRTTPEGPRSQDTEDRPGVPAWATDLPSRLATEGRGLEGRSSTIMMAASRAISAGIQGRSRTLMATVSYAHIEHNADGMPVIAGTRIKVVMIAVDRNAGLDIEEIRDQYPDLSLGQIHSALAYYYDHK